MIISETKLKMPSLKSENLPQRNKRELKIDSIYDEDN